MSSYEVYCTCIPGATIFVISSWVYLQWLRREIIIVQLHTYSTITIIGLLSGKKCYLFSLVTKLLSCILSITWHYIRKKVLCVLICDLMLAFVLTNSLVVTGERSRR